MNRVDAFANTKSDKVCEFFFSFAHLVSCGIHFVDPNNAVTLTERLSVASVIVYGPKVLNMESITNTSSGESAFENFMVY